MSVLYHFFFRCPLRACLLLRVRQPLSENMLSLRYPFGIPIVRLRGSDTEETGPQEPDEEDEAVEYVLEQVVVEESEQLGVVLNDQHYHCDAQNIDHIDKPKAQGQIPQFVPCHALVRRR